MHVKLAHVEAGLRSFNKRMPEEINRVLTDHVSDILFCPTQTSVENLNKEEILKGVYLVSDVMFNALLHFSKISDMKSNIFLTKSIDLKIRIIMRGLKIC